MQFLARGPTRLAWLVAAMLILVACGGSAAQVAPVNVTSGGEAAAYPTMAAASAPTSAPAATAVAVFDTDSPGVAVPAAEPTAGPYPGGAAPAQAPAVPVLTDPSRKIIKDAQLTLEVNDVDLALTRVNGAAAQAGGYLLESRTEYPGESNRRAFVRMAVPVDQFEVTLQRLREGANKVLDEQASGVDASQEFVDVQSQLANLEATQARIREFLNQAKTVEEALKVNAQLTEIEGQISQLKGRLQYISQRAAYSTITVVLQQTPPPTPTPEPTATTIPTRTPEPLWNPQKTTTEASNVLVTILQMLATMGLWVIIVIMPLALPIILLGLVLRFFLRRKQTP